MHEVLVNRLGGLSLPRKSVVRLTDRPDMILDVYRGRETTTQKYTYEEKKQKSHDDFRSEKNFMQSFVIRNRIRTIFVLTYRVRT